MESIEIHQEIVVGQRVVSIGLRFPEMPSTCLEPSIKFYLLFQVHPFASPFSKASSLDHWCRAGILPGVTTWWNGVAKILDVTSDEAVTWYKNNLKELQVGHLWSRMLETLDQVGIP